MPHLDAPIGFGESSPETSLSAELVTAAVVPAAMVQIRVHTPDPTGSVPPNRRTIPRIGSFDRDMATLEEHNNWPPPAAVHLLPVILPPQVTEPTLDELLRRVTERNDLQNVETVRLRVISYTVSLSRLALFLPRLQHLDLSGSILSSLRDLGCGLIHLSQLNVSNCGLNSFDGTSGLPAVRVLIANGNMIQRVGPLAELPLLQRLSAQHNRISDLGLLTFLGMCPNLAELELQGNPVCHLTLYQVTLQRSVRSLQLLDGAPLRQTCPINTTLAAQDSPSSTDGELSSLSSEINSESSVGTSESTSAVRHRPATAPTDTSGIILNLQQLPRPSSGITRRNSLSMGAPIAGSVLGWARRCRQRNGNAWISSSSSVSSSSPSSNSSTRPPSASSNGSFELQPPHASFLAPPQTHKN